MGRVFNVDSFNEAETIQVIADALTTGISCQRQKRQHQGSKHNTFPQFRVPRFFLVFNVYPRQSSIIPAVINRLRIHETVMFPVNGKLKNKIPRYSKQIATLPNDAKTTMVRIFLAVNLSLTISFFHPSILLFSFCPSFRARR